MLATVSEISRVGRFDMDRYGDYWLFTNRSIAMLFQGVFLSQNISVGAHGNVFSVTANLHGIAVEELSRQDLDCREQEYEIFIPKRAAQPLPLR